LCKYRLEEYERSREAKRKEKGFINNLRGFDFQTLLNKLKKMNKKRKKSSLDRFMGDLIYLGVREVNRNIKASKQISSKTRIRYRKIHYEELELLRLHESNISFLNPYYNFELDNEGGLSITHTVENQGKKWSDDDIEYLDTKFYEGISIFEISSNLKREIKTVLAKALTLGWDIKTDDIGYFYYFKYGSIVSNINPNNLNLASINLVKDTFSEYIQISLPFKLSPQIENDSLKLTFSDYTTKTIQINENRNSWKLCSVKKLSQVTSLKINSDFHSDLSISSKTLSNAFENSSSKNLSLFIFDSKFHKYMNERNIYEGGIENFIFKKDNITSQPNEPENKNSELSIEERLANLKEDLRKLKRD